MSSFDKVVAQWVANSCSTMSVDEKQAMLTRISHNIDLYKQLKKPAAPRPAAEAATATTGAKKKKVVKKKKVALVAASQSAVVAGIPHTTASGVSSHKLKSTTVTPRYTARQNLTPTVSPRTAAYVPAHMVPVEHVDFEFKKEVAEAIRRLRSGSPEPQPRFQAPVAAEKPAPGPVPRAPSAKLSGSKQAHLKPLQMAMVSERRDSKDAEDFQIEREVTETMVTEAAEGTHHDKPHGDNDEEEDSGLDTASYTAEREAMKSFVFGRADHMEGDGESAASGTCTDRDSEDDDSHLERSAAASSTLHNHSRNHSRNLHGEDGVSSLHCATFGERDNGEIPPLDDLEDRRRRALQMKRPSRMGICDESVNLDEARVTQFAVTPKSRGKVNVISRTLERHYLFSSLDDSDIAKIATIMGVATFQKGEQIIVKDQPNGTMFLILEGSAETFVENEQGEVEQVSLSRGSTCGDVGLMYECRNEMTVTATTVVKCATLERYTYKRITSVAMEDRRARYSEFLRRIPFFSRLSKSELTHLAETLKYSRFSTGEKVICRRAPATWLHILVEGSLDVIGYKEDGTKYAVATVHKGACVGHVEFLFHHMSVADVVAASPVVVTAKISRRTFERLAGRVMNAMVSNIEQDSGYEYYRSTMTGESPPENDLSPAFDEPPMYLRGTLRNQENTLLVHNAMPEEREGERGVASEQDHALAGAARREDSISLGSTSMELDALAATCNN